eukprot:gene11584-34284_t
MVKRGSGEQNHVRGAMVKRGSGEQNHDVLQALTPPRPVDMIIKPETSVVVITGPNTGGKTAAMKALSLTVWEDSCHEGPRPHRDDGKDWFTNPSRCPARLPCFSAVLADIGDEQSLTENLSTFSGHLHRIQALRAEADGKALILLDELGTGTDPTEGAALGVALLKRGFGGGALTIATTHHSVMTGLKFEDDRFENASVEFDEIALAPTYKLLWGIPGRSNALNIATRLGLDADVIEAARSRMDTSVYEANETVEELETLRELLNTEEDISQESKGDILALRRSINALRSEVETLQSQLSTARSNALFDMWLDYRVKLKKAKDIRRSWRRISFPFGMKLTDYVFPEPPPSDADAVASALGMAPPARDGTRVLAGSSTAETEDKARILTAKKKKKDKKKKKKNK